MSPGDAPRPPHPRHSPRAVADVAERTREAIRRTRELLDSSRELLERMRQGGGAADPPEAEAEAEDAEREERGA